MRFGKYSFFQIILKLFPLLLLFFIVFSETDTYFTNFEYFSFSFVYILIFFWVLKNPEVLGYGFIFLAGLVNDVVVGLPIGSSSIAYLLLAGCAAYIRAMTVHISLLSDWIAFIPSIAFTNSVYFIVLSILLEIDINYLSLLSETAITIIVYPLFAILFNIFRDTFLKTYVQ